MVSMRYVAVDGKRTAKKAVGELQITVLYSVTDTCATDYLPVQQDAGDNGDIDSVWFAEFAEHESVPVVGVSKAPVFADAERIDGNMRRKEVFFDELSR